MNVLLLQAYLGAGGSIVSEQKGEAKIDRTSLPGGLDESLVIVSIEPRSKNKIVRLGCHTHRCKVSHDLGIIRAVEVVVIQCLDRRVVDIDVHDRVIVGGSKTVDRLAQTKESVDQLRIPRRKKPRQQPDAKMRGNKRGHDQKHRDLRRLSVLIGGQW